MDVGISLGDVAVVRDVAWMDERPQCRHLIASWRAGRDVGSRCTNYGLRLGQPSPGYCPMSGGFCAMEDPGWVFKPGWERWAQWQAEGHDHITLDVWPGFRAGMLGCYVVAGDCMAPTWDDGGLVVARMGRGDFTDGAACVISRRVQGLPIRGRYLKRVERIGEKLLYLTADNPTFEPVLVPAERALVRVEEGQAGGLFGGTVVVQDETPLWLAWETAKETWLESKRRRSGGENTVKAYSLAVRQFFDWAGMAPWQVSPAVAQEWAKWMGGERDGRGPLADSSVAQKLAALSSLYEFVQRRYTFRTPAGQDVYLWAADRANPFDGVERPRISPYGRAKYPSVEELQAILGQINTRCLRGKRDFALLFAIATTCKRSSEILNLRWGDLQEMEDGNFSFWFRYKRGERRQGVLNRTAYQAICAYLEADGRPAGEMGEGDYLFVAIDPERIRRLRPEHEVEENAPISNSLANRILKKYAKRAGVDVERAHIHGLRHAGARLRVRQMKEGRGGVDYMELLELLGHSSLAVTQIYSQTTLEEPEDPGGAAAAAALLPKGPRRRKRVVEGEQGELGI